VESTRALSRVASARTGRVRGGRGWAVAEPAGTARAPVRAVARQQAVVRRGQARQGVVRAVTCRGMDR
jgi:hypothetical protein